MTEGSTDRFFADAGVGGGVLTSETAPDFVRRLSLGSAASSRMLEALESLAEWDGPAAPDGEFEFRVGSWTLDLRKEGARASVLAAILACAIAATNAPVGFGAIAIAVVPSLFNVERVRLSEDQEALLIDVRRTPTLTTHFLSAERIYQRLPAEVREQIDSYDFADFIAVLQQLGLAEPEPVTGTVRVRTDDERSPHQLELSWRLQAGSLRPAGGVLPSRGQPTHQSEIVSVYESLHASLSRSTSFGILIHALEIAPGRSATVHSRVRSMSRVTQESFATYASDLVVPGTTLSQQHQRYRSELALLIDGVGSTYLRLHAAWAVARACMQTPVDDFLVTSSISSLRAKDLRAIYRPDDRRRALQEANVSLAALEADLASSGDVALDLTPSALSFKATAQWERVAEPAYDFVAQTLARIGVPSLDYDGQGEAARLILGPSQAPNDRPVASSRAERTWVAIQAVDQEAINLPTRSAHFVDPEEAATSAI